MAEIYSTEYPEQRVYIGDVSVKFRDGVAEVSEEIAEALLQLDGFESGLPEAGPNIEAEAAIEAEVERLVAIELERIAGETAAQVEAEVERRVAEALEDTASGASDENSADEGATAPEKRKPGRPRKTETAE